MKLNKFESQLKQITFVSPMHFDDQATNYHLSLDKRGHHHFVISATDGHDNYKPLASISKFHQYRFKINHEVNEGFMTTAAYHAMMKLIFKFAATPVKERHDYTVAKYEINVELKQAADQRQANIDDFNDFYQTNDESDNNCCHSYNDEDEDDFDNYDDEDEDDE